MHRSARRRSAHRHPVRLAAVALLAASLLAACSSDDDDADTPTTTEASADGTTTEAGDGTTTTTEATGTSAAPEGEVATGEPVPSSGCGPDATTTTAELERRDIGDRYYLVSTPADPAPDEPLPVVLDLHGLAEGAQVHSQMSQFGPYAAENGFIAAFPHGTGQPVKWQVSLDREGNPDLVFLDALLDDLEATRCVDTSRVYATGLSYGAIMSSTLGCAMTDRIAAIAPVDGLSVPDGCEPERPVPVLTFHGTKDPILLFNGGVANLGGILGGPDEKTEPPEADLNGEGYPAAAATWAEMNGCQGEPVDEDLTESVIERTWDCPPESPVVFEIMVGAGHSWPGSEFSEGIAGIVGPTDTSIDGTDMIWRFFQRFQLPPDGASSDTDA
ncbi:MAG TPA: PHB depolymerase family esterase [Aquihabitans sp.]|jgi:polyhydroxybutyrate depolymerase|nr:PHB depolymerase family esterase [Aquihabitans sp.]